MYKFILTFSLLFSSVAIAQVDLPNKDVTPGAILNTDLSKVCVSNYSKGVRDVSESLKKKVYKLYNVPVEQRGSYNGVMVSKIDHLVPLSIGGANDITNLWPHYFNVPSGYGVLKKNKLENYIKVKMCNGGITQEKAFQCFTNNWIDCYKEQFE